MRPEDLPDTPLETRRAQTRPATSEAVDLLEEISSLRETHGWAADTLEGIYETVERTGVVTEGQRRAIENIANARSRFRGGRSRWRR